MILMTRSRVLVDLEESDDRDGSLHREGFPPSRDLSIYVYTRK